MLLMLCGIPALHQLSICIHSNQPPQIPHHPHPQSIPQPRTLTICIYSNKTLRPYHLHPQLSLLSWEDLVRDKAFLSHFPEAGKQVRASGMQWDVVCGHQVRNDWRVDN